jgi:serine/threonine-protein kinase
MQPASVKQAPFPERVGRYELVLPIGTGGMATVYLAHAESATPQSTTGAPDAAPDGRAGTERKVALKLVHAHLRADEESKLHLLEEAKLAALIRHPNVIRVLEVDEDPVGVFLVMEYIEGETLSGLARLAKAAGRPMSRRLMARVLNDALLGLHAAHELKDLEGKPLNLVHRDFSPQNILVSVHGQTRLGDFGVAKAADRAVRTKTGLTKGKIAYMSPEQARGHAVDRRCDVWAAGVVAWELLAGERIHKSEDDVATLLSIVTEKPPRLRSVLKDVEPELDDAIAWALEPKLERRCPTAEEFRSTLEGIWNAHDGIADALELGRFVREVSRDALEERKRQADAVLSARRAADSRRRSSSGRSNSGRNNSGRSGSQPSADPTPLARPKMSSGPVLVADTEASASAATESMNGEPDTVFDGVASNPPAPAHEDPALAPTNAAVVTPDPGGPNPTATVPPNAETVAATDSSAGSKVVGSDRDLPSGPRTVQERAGAIWDEDAQYEAETRVIPDAERQLRHVATRPTEELTETSAVVPTWEQPRSRSRWALVLAAIVGAAGSTAVAWLLRDPPPEPSAASEVLHEEKTDSSRRAEATSAQREAKRKVDEPVASEVSELPLAPPEPEAEEPETTRRVGRPSHQVAKRTTRSSRPSQTAKPKKSPVRDKPKLATSPYGEPKSGQ